MKNLSTVLHSSCTSLHSHQTLRQLHSWQCKCSLSSTSSSSTFIPCVLLITILCTGWYLIVDLICISLMISDVDHLFMDLLEPDFFFFEKCLFKSSAQFLIRLLDFILFYFCCWIVWVMYFCILTPYKLYDLQIFSSILRLPFPFAGSFLWCWEVY